MGFCDGYAVAEASLFFVFNCEDFIMKKFLIGIITALMFMFNTAPTAILRWSYSANGAAMA